MEVNKSGPSDHHYTWVHETPENQGKSEGRAVVNLGDPEGPALLGNIDSVYKQSTWNRVGMLASGDLEPSEHLYVALEDEDTVSDETIFDALDDVLKEEGLEVRESLDARQLIEENEALLNLMYKCLGIDPKSHDLATEAKSQPKQTSSRTKTDERKAETARISELTSTSILTVIDASETDNSGDELLPVGTRYQFNVLEAETDKHIEDHYGDIGTETADRVDTVQQYWDLLEGEIQNLEQLGSNPKRLARAKNERLRLIRMLETREASRQQTTWIKSQNFRDLVKKTNYESASNTFTRGCPVNLRIQRMYQQDGKEIARIGRLGAITDVTNGWYSCEELVEMQMDPSKIEAKIQEIQEAIDNPKPSSLFGKVKKSLLGFRPKLNQDQIVSAERAINALKIARNTRGEALEDLIQDREEQLERQALQYLMEQIKANPQNIREGQPFNLIQLSLLNLNKRSLDSSGWMHDEATAFRDLRYILKKMNSKQILFAEASPYIAGDTIVLPTHLVDNPPMTPVDLKTFVFNLSVQGNTKNTGLQKENNDNEIARFIHEYTADANDPLFKQVYQELTDQDSSSSYQLAEDLGYFLHEFAERNGALGINCVSGKDRTGYVGSRIMIRKLKKYGEVPKENRIFRKRSIATRIARDNLPNVKVLKIDPRTALKKGLPGISRKRYALTVLPKSILSASPV